MAGNSGVAEKTFDIWQRVLAVNSFSVIIMTFYGIIVFLYYNAVTFPDSESLVFLKYYKT